MFVPVPSPVSRFYSLIFFSCYWKAELICSEDFSMAENLLTVVRC